MSSDNMARFYEHREAENRLQARLQALLLDTPHSLFDPIAPDPHIVYYDEFPKCPVKYRDEIVQLRQLVAQLTRALDALQLANRVTSTHEWFTIRNYADYGVEPEKTMRLFTLHEGGAHMIAEIRAGDLLMVAREKRKGDHE